MAKFASIDVGSNTLLLLIVEDTSGKLVSVVDECAFGRLGQGLSASNRLHPDAIQRSLAITERFRALMDQHEIAGVRAVGTQALREAENRDEFVVSAEDMLGCPIEIIAGEREASLVAGAVANSFPALCQGEVLVVDVGGGSTEIIVIRGGELLSVQSLPIGAVRLSERHLRGDPPTAPQTQALFGEIGQVLSELDLPTQIPVIGTAGTATTIASIKLQLAEYRPDRIHGVEFGRAEVAATLARLLEQTLKEKRALRGLEPQRADVIAGGVAIYSRVLEHVQAPRFIVSDRGVRWGLAYEMAPQSSA